MIRDLGYHWFKLNLISLIMVSFFCISSSADVFVNACHEWCEWKMMSLVWEDGRWCSGGTTTIGKSLSTMYNYGLFFLKWAYIQIQNLFFCFLTGKQFAESLNRRIIIDPNMISICRRIESQRIMRKSWDCHSIGLNVAENKWKTINIISMKPMTHSILNV